MSKRTFFAGVAVCLLLGLIGAKDAQDEDIQAAQYCYNVKHGIWPDYEGSYKKDCRTELTTRER